MNEPEVIIFERSPFGNLDAIVQQDGRTLYFYLAGGESHPTKACWLGNLIKGPLEINTEEMEQGIPPLIPRIHCDHPEGRSIPAEDDLEIVWFEEGNGAAVLDSGSVIGIIPPWSGVEKFAGYARDCLAETAVAWPMPQTNSMQRRIDRAKSFWDSFSNGNPFGELQPRLLEAFEMRFGTQQNYWAIDGEEFPNRGLLQASHKGKTTFVTVGMSLFPLPDIEMYVENPSVQRRVEIAFQVDEKHVNKQLTDEVSQSMARLASMPWRKLTWFGHQHSCEFRLESIPGQHFALFFMDPREPVLSYRDDPVQTLWLVPIDESDLNALKANNSSFMASDTFIARLPF